MDLIERCKLPNNGLFISFATMFIVFLAAELMFRVYDLYRIFPLVDIISHLLSGMTVATGAFWIASLTKIKRKRLTALITTFMIGFVWEVLEEIDDMVAYNSPYLIDNFFWDGVFDITMMIAGGVIAFWLIYIFKTRTRIMG